MPPVWKATIFVFICFKIDKNGFQTWNRFFVCATKIVCELNLPSSALNFYVDSGVIAFLCSEVALCLKKYRNEV